MNILVITDVLWREDNGVGNSYSNIFKNMPDVKIANICCQHGGSDNSVSTSAFQISEARILRNLKNKSISPGLTEQPSASTDGGGEGKLFRMIKRSRLQIFFWGRNLIWRIGRWKNDDLRRFIDEFGPDLIFAQLQDKLYLNNLVSYVKKYTDKPLLLYAWDDVYSLRQFSFSPLFWIDRLFQRRSIRKLTKNCSILYTICNEQKEEYARTLKVRTELLFKGHTFDEIKIQNEKREKPIRIIYTGNLYSGRYQTLLRVCRALHKINESGARAEIDIYSGSPLTDRQIKKLNLNGSSHFYGKVSEKEVQTLQEKADVLLHIEPFSLKGSLLCRLSFSTKLVDYFYKGKCIFAVGHERCASMKYLKRWDAAIVADSVSDIKSKFEVLLLDGAVVENYAQKAWECGEKNHQIKAIQNALLNDFSELTKNKELQEEL